MKYFDGSIVSEPGNPIKPVYKPLVNKDGTITLVQEGFVNTDEEIQSYEESVDIDVIVARYMNGDLDALNKHVGQYGDFTQMPKTYAEVLQMQIDAKNTFMSLPVEIRQKFDNDPNQFFAQSGTEDWFKKLEPLITKKDEPIKETKEE